MMCFWRLMTYVESQHQRWQTLYDGTSALWLTLLFLLTWNENSGLDALSSVTWISVKKPEDMLVKMIFFQMLRLSHCILPSSISWHCYPSQFTLFLSIVPPWEQANKSEQGCSSLGSRALVSERNAGGAGWRTLHSASFMQRSIWSACAV